MTWQDALRLAGSRARAGAWLAREGWWRVYRDVYASPVVDDGPEVRCRALRRVLPSHAALSHRTALWVLGVDVLGRRLDVTVPRGHHLEARPGVRTHQAALPARELCDVDGLLVVSAARAVVDVARSEATASAVAVGDAALRAGRTTPALVEAALARAPGLRGCRAARTAVGLLDGRAESPPESVLRVALVSAGLPGVEAQVDLYEASGRHAGRADLLIDGLVVVEFDGRAAHLAREGFAHERRRQNRLLEAGLELRRFSADDLTGPRLSAACQEVQRALVLARARPRHRLHRGPDTLRPPRLTVPPTRADLAQAA